jgi:uncharacterized protein (TIGR00251 family)
MIELHIADDDVLIPIRVVAGARRTAIVGEHGGRLRIAVNQPPERGRANQAVVELLASELDLPRGRVTIRSGETRPRKSLHVAGVTEATVREWLARCGRT